MAAAAAAKLPALRHEAEETAAVKKSELRSDECPRVKSAASCSTSSSGSGEAGPSTRRLSMRRPDGSSSAEAGPADLDSLEKALRRESVLLDGAEIAHLTLPSTPLRDSVGEDVKTNLELASEKLSKLAPGE